MKACLRFILILGVSCLGACAGLSVHPVADDATARGIRYYHEAPFLFVYPDGKAGIAAEIKWLPDTRHVMSARPYGIFAKNETTLEFTNSVLTSATITTDETAVVKASIDALGKMLAAANTGDQETQIPGPQLYRIIIRDGQIALKGGTLEGPNGEAVEINLTLPGGAK